MKKERKMKKVLFPILALVLALGLAIPMAATPVKAVEIGDIVDLPVTIRDFHGIGWGSPGGDGYYQHPDFETMGPYGLDTGIVQTTLGGDGKPVYTGTSGNPSTHGQTAFDQWYRDTANVNMPTDTTLTLTWDGTKYVYSSSSFFPIDDALLGNDGRVHNYHFTLELHTSFTYQGGEVFSFTGDDDLWVFINDQLVIDLGGVHSQLPASVNLDSLGLTSGETYDFDLFFAERNTTLSNFKVETTIALEEEPSIEVEKDYRYTNVCFERDNDLDGLFNEDPIDDIDNDGDDLIDEDPVDCPGGNSLGTLLPKPGDNYQVEAVVKNNGKVSSYNPGQYYAVSTVNVLDDVDTLTILEDWSACDEISTLNPKKGGGRVVIVQVGGEINGVPVPDPSAAYQILDANMAGVTVTTTTATAVLEDVKAGTTILMYVKFGPGLKGQTWTEYDGEPRINYNRASVEYPVPEDLEAWITASANLIVVEKE